MGSGAVQQTHLSVSAGITIAASGMVVAWLGLIHSQGSGPKPRLVQSLDCFFGTLDHLDECEPAAVASLAVRANCRAQHTAIWGEHLPQLIGGGIERQVSNIQLLQNVLTFWAGARKRRAQGRCGRGRSGAAGGLMALIVIKGFHSGNVTQERARIASGGTACHLLTGGPVDPRAGIISRGRSRANADTGVCHNWTVGLAGSELEHKRQKAWLFPTSGGSLHLGNPRSRSPISTCATSSARAPVLCRNLIRPHTRALQSNGMRSRPSQIDARLDDHIATANCS